MCLMCLKMVVLTETLSNVLTNQIRKCVLKFCQLDALQLRVYRSGIDSGYLIINSVEQ